MCIALSQQSDFPLPAKRKNKKCTLNNTVFRSRLVGPIKARIQARKPTLCVCVGLQVLGACFWRGAISTHSHTHDTKGGCINAQNPLKGMSSDESEGSEGIGVLRLHIHKLPRIHSGKVAIVSDSFFQPHPNSVLPVLNI